MSFYIAYNVQKSYCFLMLPFHKDDCNEMLTLLLDDYWNIVPLWYWRKAETAENNFRIFRPWNDSIFWFWIIWILSSRWSLLPIVIKQFRPSITLASWGKAHISRRCKITTFLCFVIRRQLNMWKRKQKMPFPLAPFYTQSPLPSLCSRIQVLHPHNSQEITLPQEKQIWFLPSCPKINFSIL